MYFLIPASFFFPSLLPQLNIEKKRVEVSEVNRLLFLGLCCECVVVVRAARWFYGTRTTWKRWRYSALLTSIKRSSNHPVRVGAESWIKPNIPAGQYGIVASIVRILTSEYSIATVSCIPRFLRSQRPFSFITACLPAMEFRMLVLIFFWAPINVADVIFRWIFTF